ncbi:hypothetical protein AOLI_G00083960 [Acnodon oligacanthus]
MVRRREVGKKGHRDRKKAETKQLAYGTQPCVQLQNGCFSEEEAEYWRYIEQTNKGTETGKDLMNLDPEMLGQPKGWRSRRAGSIKRFHTLFPPTTRLPPRALQSPCDRGQESHNPPAIYLTDLPLRDYRLSERHTG